MFAKRLHVRTNVKFSMTSWRKLSSNVTGIDFGVVVVSNSSVSQSLGETSDASISLPFLNANIRPQNAKKTAIQFT